MSFTIGRFTADHDPASVEQTGDRVDIRFNVLASTLAISKVHRQQLLGLVDNDDEPVVPITWSQDTDLDGFYRIRSVDVSPVENYLTSKLMRVDVSAERIGRYAYPFAEVSALSAVRTNSHSITTVTPRVMVPSNALSYFELPSGWLYGGRSSWEGEDGNLHLVCEMSSPSLPTSALFTHGLRTDSYYPGSAKIEQLIGGTWYPVIGRQVPPDAVLRVNNGFVRFRLFDDANTLGLTGDAWSADTDQWDTLPEDLHLYNDTDSASGDVDSTGGLFFTILRNDPETVVLRVTCNGGSDNGTAYDPVQIDMSLRRGCPFVEFVFQFPFNGDNAGWRATATTACTSVTGGIERTSYDANGWKWGALITESITTDLVNGYVYRTATDSIVHSAVYAVYNPALTSTQPTSAEIRNTYWMATNVKMNVVAR